VRGRLALVARAAWRGVGELYGSEGLTHAAAIAFYALLSIFPFFLLIFSDIGADLASEYELTYRSLLPPNVPATTRAASSAE